MSLVQRMPERSKRTAPLDAIRIQQRPATESMQRRTTNQGPDPWLPTQTAAGQVQPRQMAATRAPLLLLCASGKSATPCGGRRPRSR